MRNVLSLVLILASLPGWAQSAAKEYPDGHGGRISIPMGDISFADEVVKYDKGSPRANPLASDSTQALGVPNYRGGISHFAELGCGGSLVVRFTDNVIMDMPGPDVYIFEVGKYTEATQLHISNDGRSWVSIGRIEGGTAAVDLAGIVKPGELFRYLMLTDLRTACGGDDSWPGAEIDAIAAIGSARNISLKSSVLFKLNEAILKPEARKTLDSIAIEINKLPGAELVVEGHTDSTGTKQRNEVLSQQRAQSVKDYLLTKLDKKFTIKAVGHADLFPIASNRNKEGQERNRRVSIVVIISAPK